MLIPDVLHNIKGVIIYFIKIAKSTIFDKKFFKKAIRNITNRKSSGSLKGKDLRKLVFNHKQFITQSVSNTITKEQLEITYKMFSLFSKIVYIVYQTEKQKDHHLQAYLFALIFKFNASVESFPFNNDLKSVYLHSILSHFSFFFAKGNLMQGSTENGEQLFARMTRETGNTNNTITNLFLLFSISDFYKKTKNVNKDQKQTSHMNLMINFSKNTIWNDVQIKTTENHFYDWKNTIPTNLLPFFNKTTNNSLTIKAPSVLQ